MGDLILALDFGGTKLSAALATASSIAEGRASWRELKRVPSPPGADAQRDIGTMVHLGHGLLGGERPIAVGVSFGGPVEFSTGTVRLSHHVPGWENIPLRERLAAEFRAPVQLDNDANAAALGEHHFGAGREHHDLMYLTVSTGVGGGWVLNGHPWRGHQCMAGEIGHTVVDPAGPVCLCGKRGCVERLASGPYMAQDLQQAWREGAKGWSRQGGEMGVQEINGEVVAEAAAAGDEAALKVLERSGWAVGVAIGNAANLINPQIFVLGGGVTKSGQAWWSAVRRAARETALPQVDFLIEPSALGDDAPLWGAVALARGVASPGMGS